MARVMADPPGEHPVVLFDGVCNLCNATVNFLIDRDPHGTLRFAALQSPAGRKILEGVGQPAPEGSDPNTIVLVEGGRVHERSSAALGIVRHLRGAWPLLAAFAIVPPVLRDALYRWFAARRYRWFGRAEICRVPTPELRARFLE
jgi:predicted DCC family thiol-disulfide oxidoreductase YuxK